MKIQKNILTWMFQLFCLLLVCSAYSSALWQDAAQKAATQEKVIADPAEYDAYVHAMAVQDPAQKAAELDGFLAKYPNTIMKLDVLDQLMASYQQSGNQAKVEETCERVLSADPDNLRALAMKTDMTRSRATEKNDAKLAAEASITAGHGMQALEKWQKLEGMSDEDYKKLRDAFGQVFHGALGYGAYMTKNDVAAREHYLKSLAIDSGNLLDNFQLGVVMLRALPLNPTGFWYIAKASALSKSNPAAHQVMAGYGRTEYARYHGAEDGWDALMASAGSGAAPPAGFTVRKVGTARSAGKKK